VGAEAVVDGGVEDRAQYGLAFVQRRSADPGGGKQRVELADGAGHQFAHADRAEELEQVFVDGVGVALAGGGFSAYGASPV